MSPEYGSYHPEGESPADWHPSDDADELSENDQNAPASEIAEEEDENPMSQRLFENVYEQIKRGSPGMTPERHAELFIADLAERAGRHIDPVEQAGVTNQKIFGELWQRMASAFGGSEQKKEDAEAIYRRLTEHVNRCVRERIVDPRTAKVFLRTLPALKHIGDYNDVTRNPEDVSPDDLREKNQAFAAAADELYQAHPDAAKSEQDGSFYHFNEHTPGDVINRIYVSAKLSGNPETAIRAWQTALEKTGLQESVYFKIPIGLSKRFETIIVYQKDLDREEDLEALFSAFYKDCPEEVLNDRDMPTGIPLRRGVTFAPEPKNINALIRATGSRETISYNELIASFAKLSFELSYSDAQHRGDASVTPKSMKADAAKYFDQLIALSGINPDTMVPNAQGGKLPSWAERIRSEDQAE